MGGGKLALYRTILFCTICSDYAKEVIRVRGIKHFTVISIVFEKHPLDVIFFHCMIYDLCEYKVLNPPLYTKWLPTGRELLASSRFKVDIHGLVIYLNHTPIQCAHNILTIIDSIVNINWWWWWWGGTLHDNLMCTRIFTLIINKIHMSYEHCEESSFALDLDLLTTCNNIMTLPITYFIS